jgi:hypothetical protein
MMTAHDPDTDQLLERAGQGEALACQQLLVRHRPRLRQMLALRMDRRLAPRIDPPTWCRRRSAGCVLRRAVKPPSPARLTVQRFGPARRRPKAGNGSFHSGGRTNMVLTLEQEPTQTKRWAQLVARAWEDEDFKRRLLSEPAAVLEEGGIEVPPGRPIRVLQHEAEEEQDGVVTLTLPAKPSSEDLIEEDLSLPGQGARPIGNGRWCFSGRSIGCRCVLCSMPRPRGFLVGRQPATGGSESRL